jgi:cold shock CspA family protein
MRTHGTLTKWHDDRGFGFITPAQGTVDIFVHISAFPRDGERPRINEFISFETEPGQNGKLRAVRIMRPGQRTASRRPRASGHSDRATGLVGIVFGLLAMAAVGAYGYSRFTRPAPESVAVRAATALPAPSATFKCDGRTMCSQMTSCEEARYFLQHCPNPKMDGNNDGEPCEQQWCN